VEIYKNDQFAAEIRTYVRRHSNGRRTGSSPGRKRRLQTDGRPSRQVITTRAKGYALMCDSALLQKDVVNLSCGMKNAFTPAAHNEHSLKPKSVPIYHLLKHSIITNSAHTDWYRLVLKINNDYLPKHYQQTTFVTEIRSAVLEIRN
jgi:hypothetical protein